jgi:hypothetical protein
MAGDLKDGGRGMGKRSGSGFIGPEQHWVCGHEVFRYGVDEMMEPAKVENTT